ncbi:alpha-L-fucosidase [Microbulbifer sp. 2304DJ12-6]|uniref:alpha-L-fucosidase n=1 Tax=Microbulbifer sp. 2304DJ12-6 TaxID=3233340 RepID=UPI0039AFD31C
MKIKIIHSMVFLATAAVLVSCSLPGQKAITNAPQTKPAAASKDDRYQPHWSSLNTREIPGWFGDAKFGIFIHWGPYSVPAYSPKGTYAEWYQYWLQSRSLFGNGEFNGEEISRYHKKTYGEDFSYYQFADDFRADLFNPEQWADLFKDAGAKYVVLTSKHHDGFALWPSEEANGRGFPWNSYDTAAKRDIVGELSHAVKNSGLKMGLYYSLYEWYHPQWKGTRGNNNAYVDQHFTPQFKDLVESYEPDLLWGDGEWDMQSEDWKTPELIAWLFNDSKVKDTVVINDRWGNDTRQSPGFTGYLTTEYEAQSLDGVWEECRGLGFSFGYNQNEHAADYSSAHALVLSLIDIVSNGGNLLLDIGPDSRGNIPVIMQDRLLSMGAWLKINGEAIYGTQKWKRPTQWSEGRRDYKPETHYVGNHNIFKLTTDPEPGYAVKQVFFTQKVNADENNLYAILPQWPESELTLKGVQASPDSKITLLGSNQDLSWENRGGNLIVTMPSFSPNHYSSEQQYAYTLRITQPKH